MYVPQYFLTVPSTRTDIVQFHDDGEKELGPTVATMSLGGSATMKIRMKASYYFGRSGKKYDPKIPLLPGSFNYAERKRVHALKGKISAQEFQKEIDVLFEATKKKSLAPPCLTMELNHGDIIVMHGSKMQQYFEVCFTYLVQCCSTLICIACR